MKALVYLGPRSMQLQELPDPVPTGGEAIVRVALAAVCGSDLHGFREPSPRRIPPLVMGHEIVGRIEAVGEDSDRRLVGRRVVVKPIIACGRCTRCLEGRTNLCPEGKLLGRDLPGGFAERVAVPTSHVVPIADGVQDDIATLSEPVANAVHVVGRSISGGETVVVIGAGPMGLVLVRTACLAGAGRVFATDRIASRVAFAEAQGAEALPAGNPAVAVLAETGDQGADVVIDAVGTDDTWSSALQAVRPGGRIEMVGLAQSSGLLQYHALASKEVTITGSYGWTDAEFGRAVEWIEAGAIDPSGWFTTMPLPQGQHAFESLVDGSDLVKVLLKP